MTDIKDLQERVGAVNEKNGFNTALEVPKEFRHLYWMNELLLVVSELTEAQDELRHGRKITEEYFSYPPTPASLAVEFASGVEATEYFQSRTEGKPEGAPSEIADAIIRLLGICFEAEIDIEDVIERKLAFNATRPYKHGGKKF